MAARLLLLLLCLVLGLGASCGETNIQAITRLRPRGSEMRARLARISSVLPPVGSVIEASPAPTLEPPLVFDFRRKSFNADLLMASELTDPDTSPAFDLMLSPHLGSCLVWTGPRNPLDRSVWDERTDLGPECERAFALPWLIVARTVRLDLPERIDLELFVVDLRSERIVASLPLHVRGRYAKADLGRGRFATEALAQIRSDAYVATRCAVARRLARLPGASIDLRESWLGGPRDPCLDAEKSGFHPVEEPLLGAPLPSPAPVEPAPVPGVDE